MMSPQDLNLSRCDEFREVLPAPRLNPYFD